MTIKFVYIGQFENDKICGYGKKIFTDGTSIEGEWENNKLKKCVL